MNISLFLQNGISLTGETEIASKTEIASFRISDSLLVRTLECDVGEPDSSHLPELGRAWY